MRAFGLTLSFLIGFCFVPTTAAQDNPILFCTQVPHPADFAMLASPFANHIPTVRKAVRGGDLYIRYPNGNLRNLTQLAGYGETGMQGDNAIAVRDPHVHWNGNKALFSMVIGAPERYDYDSYAWQIYEVTGLGESDTPVITKVTNQPEIYNNVRPIYGTDDRIIFVSDIPRGQQPHLYPQHDEYESTDTVTGLWKFDPADPDSLEMLTHSPSGDFSPFIDSFGRVVFIRWDHLKRDQQADSDIANGNIHGTFNFADESANAAKTSILPDIEVFPEPRSIRTDLFSLPQWANTNSHDFNIFNPWMMNEDGSELEALNHLGRHETASYFTPNFTNDPNLVEFFRGSRNYFRNMFHIVESPVTPGLYFGTDGAEFFTHSAGGVISIYLPPGTEPNDAAINYVTHPDTRFADDNPSANHSGLYRNPVPLASGEILVVHTSETSEDANLGDRFNPVSKYEFRLQLLGADGAYQSADGKYLTGNGITKSISYYDPDELVSFDGVMWEMFPVEVRPRPLPADSTLAGSEVPAIESALFSDANVDVEAFRAFLKRKDLALVVTRDVTSRDRVDRQQPFNLRVVDGGTETINPDFPSNVYDVKYLQFLQGDQIRGIGGINDPDPGRRVIAQFMHDATAMQYNLPTTGEQGSANLLPDGSAAAIVPANRAMTWQLTDEDNLGIVRERIWMSFVPGEIRVCSSCHGGNSPNQAGLPEPTNPPSALTELLNHVKTIDSDDDDFPDLFDQFDGPDTLTVIRGTQTSGNLVSLATSDNVDLSIQRNQADIQSRAVFEVSTGSASGVPNSLSVSLEASVFARSRVDQRIDLFNFDSGSWEQIDNRQASRFNDRVDTIPVFGTLAKFFEPGTHAIRIRVRFLSPQARQQFTANIDMLKLLID